MFREVSALIFKDGTSYISQGSAGHVDFPDLCDIWDDYKRNGKSQDSFCMYHTHPLGFGMASERDLSVMRGWRLALGFLPVFRIIYSPEKCLEVGWKIEGEEEILIETPYDTTWTEKMLYGFSYMDLGE